MRNEVMFMQTEEKKSVSLSLPLSLYKVLRRYAEEDGRSLPRQIRQILRRYVWARESGSDFDMST